MGAWHIERSYPVTSEFLRKRREGHLLGIRRTELEEGAWGEWSELEQLLWGIWFREAA